MEEGNEIRLDGIGRKIWLHNPIFVGKNITGYGEVRIYEGEFKNGSLDGFGRYYSSGFGKYSIGWFKGG